MFFKIVQLMNSPEVFIPSLIRLDSFDNVYCPKPDSLYRSARFGFVLGSRFVDREVGVATRDLAVRFDQLPSQVIEAAPKLVNGFANDQRQIAQRKLMAQFYLANEQLKFRILLADEFIGIVVPDSNEFGFKITDVLFGPFDF